MAPQKGLVSSENPKKKKSSTSAAFGSTPGKFSPRYSDPRIEAIKINLSMSLEACEACCTLILVVVIISGQFLFYFYCSADPGGKGTLK